MTKPKTSTKTTAKCPWGSKMAAITPKDAMAPHVDAGGRICVGVGITRVKPLIAVPAARHA